ncbi:MAG: hypothetical protein JXD18_08500 [Anaerolineae bacterium]|nr:hypothetical protein [Anaerolineae bacterium]
MARKSNRNQRLFWTLLSLFVVISMGISLAISFTPTRPQATLTPVPTFTPLPTRTPTPPPG